MFMAIIDTWTDKHIHVQTYKQQTRLAIQIELSEIRTSCKHNGANLHANKNTNTHAHIIHTFAHENRI